MNIEIKNLYDLNNTISKDYLIKFKYPFEALEGLKDYIINLGNNLGSEYIKIKDNVWIHKDAKISDTASILPPTIICKNAEIRHCAFIRGAVIIGDDSVIGNSCEIKNSIIFNNAEVPHFNYVGDSILGFHSHMGAGAITSNVKSDKKDVIIHNEGEEIKTNRKKVGAFLADYVEVGCNSVLNPGTIIGKHSNIYPLSSIRGVINEYSIYKNGKVVKKY